MRLSIYLTLKYGQDFKSMKLCWQVQQIINLLFIKYFKWNDSIIYGTTFVTSQTILSYNFCRFQFGYLFVINLRYAKRMTSYYRNLKSENPYEFWFELVLEIDEIISSRSFVCFDIFFSSKFKMNEYRDCIEKSTLDTIFG